MEIKNRRWLLLISIPAIAFIMFIIFFTVFESPVYRPPWMPPPQQPRMLPIYMLPLSVVIMFFAIVPFSYYLISKKLGEKIENNMKILSRLVSANNNKNNLVPKKNSMEINTKNIILKFLSPSERKVLEKLVEGKGISLQADISRMDGMTKLKTHRIVKDLEMKGIIKTEKYGKTKRIILSKDVKDAMHS
jgi:predicted transcriptional regulator